MQDGGYGLPGTLLRGSSENYTFSNVVDLAALSDEVVGVVRETMHPEHASLWLRPDPARRGREGPE